MNNPTLIDRVQLLEAAVFGAIAPVSTEGMITPGAPVCRLPTVLVDSATDVQIQNGNDFTVPFSLSRGSKYVIAAEKASGMALCVGEALQPNGEVYRPVLALTPFASSLWSIDVL